MAFGICDIHDTMHGTLLHSVRLKTQCTHDWPRLPPRDRPHRRHVQFEFDLRQLDVPLPECFFHSDAQGEFAKMRDMQESKAHSK